MNKTQLIAFLMSLGLTKAQAEKTAQHAPDDAAKALEQKEIDDMRTAFKATQVDVFKNDPDFLKEIEGSAKGKLMDIVTREIKATFGLEAAEIKDKDIKEVVKIAKDKATLSLDKTAKDLQTELSAANTKIKEYEETVIPNTRKEVDEHKKNFDIARKLSEKVSKNKLRVPMDPVLSSIDSALKAGYTLDLDDKGELMFKDKVTNLQPQNKDKTGLLSIDDFIVGKLTEWDFLQKSNADPAGKKIETVKVEGDDSKTEKPSGYAPHLEAAMKHLDEIKKT